MGLSPFKNSFSVWDKGCCCNKNKPVPQPSRVAGNPDPKNYKINATFTVEPYLVVDITYPDCTNFEGRKIMVFEDINFVQLARMKIIDPHFTDDTSKSPIARFRPTEDGWNDAIEFAKRKSKKK